MLPDEPVEEERQEELPQDNGQTPFRPADPGRDDTRQADDPAQTDAAQLDDTHPLTDTNVDSHEQYDEGLTDAAEAPRDPAANDTVVGYNPDEIADNPS
jgi:hypothetical protein